MEPGRYAKSVNVATETVTEWDNTPLPGAYGGQGSAFESLYWVTGDEKYLKPFIDGWTRNPNKDRASPGGMIAELYQRGALAPLGDKLDNVLMQDPLAFAQKTGDTSKLEEALKYDITELQRYPMFYTTVEPFTDRVFLYAISNATKCYTGGFATRNKYCRTHAVSWEGLGTDFAAMVVEATPKRFKALVYNFSDKRLEATARLWTLEHGYYSATTTWQVRAGERASMVPYGKPEIQRGTGVKFWVVPRKIVTLELEQAKKLDDERDRADLALSPVDTKFANGVVESFAHNIGARDAEDVVVALVDDKGVERQRISLWPLAAPIDLVPKRIPFRFDGIPALVPSGREGDAKGWSIVIDPDGKVPEIYEGNNRVELR
jgi:hypothetical protein